MGHVVCKPSRVSPGKQTKDERRIILIGKTGTGKSTLGNAILNKRDFSIEDAPMESMTMSCKVGKVTRKDGTNVVVVDTPGIKNTKLHPKNIFEELCKCKALTKPGVHIFCLTIRVDGPFTPENIDTLQELCAFFGEEIFKYMIVVFTHSAEIGKTTTIDNCFGALPNEFREQISRFGDNKIAIECKGDTKKQINELFAKIENIIKRNNGGYYSEEKFNIAEEAFRKRMEEEESIRAQMKAKVLEKTGEGFDMLVDKVVSGATFVKSWLPSWFQK